MKKKNYLNMLTYFILNVCSIGENQQRIKPEYTKRNKNNLRNQQKQIENLQRIQRGTEFIGNTVNQTTMSFSSKLTTAGKNFLSLKGDFHITTGTDNIFKMNILELLKKMYLSSINKAKAYPLKEELEYTLKKEKLPNDDKKIKETILRNILTDNFHKKKFLENTTTVGYNPANNIYKNHQLTQGEKKEITKEIKEHLKKMEQQDFNNSPMKVFFDIFGFKTQLSKAFSVEGGSLATTAISSDIKGSKIFETFNEEGEDKYISLVFTKKLGSSKKNTLALKGMYNLFRYGDDFLGEKLLNNNTIITSFSREISKKTNIGIQILNTIQKEKEINLEEIGAPIFIDSEKFHFSVGLTGDYKTKLDIKNLKIKTEVSIYENKLKKTNIKLSGSYSHKLDFDSVNGNIKLQDYETKQQNYIGVDPDVEIDTLQPNVQDYHMVLWLLNSKKSLEEFVLGNFSGGIEYSFKVKETEFKIKLALPTFWRTVKGILSNWSYNPFESDNKYAGNYPKIAFSSSSNLIEKAPIPEKEEELLLL